MAERMYRTQILLEPEQQRALAEIARQEGRSISELVREMVRAQLDQRARSAEMTKRRQIAALERVQKHREAIVSRLAGEPLDINPSELIAEIQMERDAEIVGRDIDDCH